MVWQAWTSLDRARVPIEQASQLVDQLEQHPQRLLNASGRQQAEKSIGAIEQDAAKARQIVASSKALHTFGLLPVLDTQRQGILDLTSDVESAAQAGTMVLDQVNELTATSHGTNINLPSLSLLVQAVETAHDELATLRKPTNGLWGPIAAPRAN